MSPGHHDDDDDDGELKSRTKKAKHDETTRPLDDLPSSSASGMAESRSTDVATASPRDQRKAIQVVRLLVSRSRRGGWLESTEFEDVRHVLRLLSLSRPALVFGQVNFSPRMLHFLPHTHCR